MAPELYTNKCIKDRVQAAVGESNEPAHVECIVQVVAYIALIKWWNQFVSQNFQKDHHVVRHPADKKHCHNTEDQPDCSVFCVRPGFFNLYEYLNVAETHHCKSNQKKKVLLASTKHFPQQIFVFTAQWIFVFVVDGDERGEEKRGHRCCNADYPHQTRH